MKNCSHCKISVKTERKTCPLCCTYLEESSIKDETKLQKYPKKKPKSKMSLQVKIALFISILLCAASIIANVITFKSTGPYYWSIVVFFGIIYLWIIVRYVIMGRGLITTRILSVTVTSSIIIFLIEFCVCLVNNKNPIEWSVNYVIPFILIAGMITINIITSLRKDLYVDSIIIMFTLALLSIIPYILSVSTNLINVDWPSIGAATISVIMILAMLIFNNKETVEELKKRFHV